MTIPATEAAFEEVFMEHYKGLYSYACIMLKNEADAEEITQNVFVKLWEKRSALVIETSLKAYLYRMVHNDCLNRLKHLSVVRTFQNEKMYSMKNESDNAEDKLAAEQLNDRLRNALRELPEQCRTIFQMSRFDELKYREIADKLGISVKTVENQMGKALRLLREKLVDFLILILLFIHF